jgi:hypothetical protein
MKSLLAAMACVLCFCGCATGTHIVTGTPHPKIKPEQVVLYQVPPAKFEIIGIVNAQSPGRYQRNMDDAVSQLKEQAAEMGANGILLGSVSPGSESVGVASGSAFGGGHAVFGSTVAVSSSGIQLSGQAIFVSQTP